MKILILACALLVADAATLQSYIPPSNQGFSATGNVRNPNFSAAIGTTSTQQQTVSTGTSFQATSGFEQSSTSGQSPQQAFIPAPAPAQATAPTGPSFSDNQLISNQGQVSSIGQSQSFNTQESFNQQSFESGQSHQQAFVPSPAPATAPTSPSFSDNQLISNQGQVTSIGQNQESFNQQSFESPAAERSEGECSEGQVRHYDGSCVTPEITRNVFVYAAPEQEPRDNLELVDIPKPKIEHNIVFIRTDELQAANEPIVIPPPQRKHIIYVLNQQSEIGGQRIIEVTTPEPRTPEVYFVNYADGETPTLPDGIDFEAALNSAVHAEGQVIGGSSNFDATERDDLDANNGANTNAFGSSATQSGSAGNFVATSGSVVNANTGSTDFSVNVATSNAGPSRSDNEGYNINVPTSNANFQVNSNVAEASSGATAQGSAASFNTFQASTSPVAPAPQQFYSSP